MQNDNVYILVIEGLGLVVGKSSFNPTISLEHFTTIQNPRILNTTPEGKRVRTEFVEFMGAPEEVTYRKEDIRASWLITDTSLLTAYIQATTGLVTNIVPFKN